MDKDNIAVITADFAQDFLEINLGRRFSKAELELLKTTLWEEEHYLFNWVYQAAKKIVAEG